MHRHECIDNILMWTKGVQVEDAALQQLKNVASMPFVSPHVACLPDVHFGIGATVGSVIPTTGAIIPATVGVDIGCGMVATRLDLRAADLPDNLHEMRSLIEKAVPHGRTNNGGPGDRGAWSTPPEDISCDWGYLKDGFKRIQEYAPKLTREPIKQLGTLGGGNHFIEVCLDEHQDVWVMLHSGSRGVGNQVGTHFIALAKEDMKRHNVHLPDMDLAYLLEGSDHFSHYVDAVAWAQRYAESNRAIMLDKTVGAIEVALGRPVLADQAHAVNCHHNYVNREMHFGQYRWITRKGAVSAAYGQMGIIPGSMGAKSYIVKGKGNPYSFNSCSHGAGRLMSRTQARKTFTLADHEAATAGVECRKDIEVLDETPACYKDIDTVMAAQEELVSIVHTLKQVLCVKG